MLGLIELLIIVSVITLIYFFVKKKDLQKIKQRSKLSQFKKISFISSGIILVGIVMIKSIISINNDDRAEELPVKISAPAMKLEEPSKSNRIFVQILFVNLDSQSLIHFDEKIHEGTSQFIGEFNYRGFDVNYSINLFNNLINLEDPAYFQGTHSISMRSPMYSSASSGSLNVPVKEGYDKLFHRNRVEGSEGFFELSRSNNERVSAYIVCHRLHPDDNLKTISKEALFEKIKFYKDADQDYNISTSSVFPFLELTKALGVSCIILLVGSTLIALGIEKSFAFPAVLLVVILCAIGVKKYEYSKYESIALDQEKSLYERKMAVMNAKEMPFFKVSAKELEKQLED